MGTSITNGGKVSRISEFEQVLFKVSGKSHLTRPDWEDVSGKSLNYTTSYWKRAESHYRRLLAELDASDPVEYWAIKYITGKAIAPGKCEWVANRFEELIPLIAKYDAETGFGDDEFCFLSLKACTENHVKALRQCSAQGVGFRYSV